MQEPDAAVAELRRIVEELGMCGACLPSTGTKSHLGSKEYWPIYAEADRLGCCLAVHGGNHIGLGFDHMNVFAPAHAIGHPLGMMINLGGMVFNGVFDRYPNLRVAYLEGGVAWLLLCMERFDSSYHTNTPINLRGDLLQLDDEKRPSEYIAKLAGEGRISVGCEGDELMLSRAIRLVGQRSVPVFLGLPSRGEHRAVPGAFARDHGKQSAERGRQRCDPVPQRGSVFHHHAAARAIVGR